AGPERQAGPARQASEARRAGGSAAAPEPVVVSPHWLSGEAGVRWTADLYVPGIPAMMGENTCTLSASLDAEQADRLHDAWKDGLREARIYFRMEAQAAKVQRAGLTMSSDTAESLSVQAN